ncbi:MAG TPA: alpha/beta fold hydrolase [Spirochaetales bacterium]|nr:alpha/beta fold hydrolase [Spirochaetales bacterium]
MRGTLRYMAVTAAVGILAGAVFSGQSFILVILSQIVVFSIAALGLNLLTGMAGQVSIGNAAFMSIGAYASVVLATRLGVPVPLAAVLGGLAAAVFGFLIGLPALRMKGFYLAIATMAFGVVVEQLIAVIPELGAHDGIRNIPSFLPGELWTYLFNLAFYLVLLWAARRVAESPVGLRWRMVRDGETPARSFGVDTARAKLSAFTLSAFYGGVAGSLYAHTVGYIRSADFGLGRSLDLLAMIMIGGLGSYQGGLAGAVIIVGLRFFFSRGFGPWLSVIIGGLLVAFTLFFPRGIAWGATLNWHKRLQVPYLWLLRKIRRRRTSMDGSSVVVSGKNMFYREAGEGRPVVLVHGNTGSCLWWRDAMDLPGWRTVAPDLPNFGRSDALDVADIDAYADSLAGFITALGLQKPVVVGHSLGGAVVMSLAARKPELAAGIVLVDSASPSGLKTPEEHYPVIELYRTSRDLMRKALSGVAPTLKDERLLDNLADDAMLMAPHAYAGNARALERFDYAGRAGAFTGPVLVLWGRKDVIVTEAMDRETAAAYKNAKLSIWDDAGHSPMVENAERFRKELLDFLAGI